MTARSGRSPATPSAPPRPENQIFSDLQDLCGSPGYIYALAAICRRNDWVAASGTLTGDCFSHLYVSSHLVRPETSALTCLLAKRPIDYSCPPTPVIQDYVAQTHALLEELHLAITVDSYAPVVARVSSGQTPSLDQLIPREALLYSGDTAYHFQYLSFAQKRYAKDTDWLRRTTASSVGDFHRTLCAVVLVQQNKCLESLRAGTGANLSALLEPFTFNVNDISAVAGLDVHTVRQVLSSFTLSDQPDVTAFSRIDDFNPTIVRPLLSHGKDTFILFQSTHLWESFYASPAYWMQDDVSYADTAAANRGTAPERLTQELLERVFWRKSSVR